jgi:predicted ATPase/class 3 adenylate cyclase
VGHNLSVDRPTGWVTLLFTDIEGSTNMWEQQQVQMSEALARHDQILRTTIESHRGYVFKTAGDAFSAAFQQPTDGLLAALSAQKQLLAEEWGTDIPIRVRMGLHSGYCEERDGDYFGPTVNRAARLSDTAHGGQTVVSQSTVSVMIDSPPGGSTFVDLGDHRLKDLGRPERVFQVNLPGLGAEFPPLRSLTNPKMRHNLPEQVSSFVGRESELVSVSEQLKSSRLLTLIGAGGAGKTRIALQVAADLVDGSGDGVWLVELAPISDPDLVSREVANTLGVREEPDRPLVQTLAERLRDRNLLLVLDNCERLLDPVAELAGALLRACPNVAILATSRQRIGVPGEVLVRVPSMGLPPPDESDPDEIGRFDGIGLFIERATAMHSEFRFTAANALVIASICRHLDGIPLAIELAVVRLHSLSPEEIESRLDKRLRLLTGGSRDALARQQTLRAAIDWSYEVLPPAEQLVLDRLSVFAGDWSLAAAEEVVSGAGVLDHEVLDLVDALVDKSLVQADHSSEITRFRLLETIRQYAAAKLAERGDDEVRRLRTAHRDAFHHLAEQAATHLRGEAQQDWLERLDHDLANLRAAIDFCIASSDSADRQAGLCLAADLRWYWYTRGLYREGAEDLAALLEPADGMPHAVRARALTCIGELYSYLGSYEAARARLIEAEQMARELGDPALTADALRMRSWIDYRQGNCGAGLVFAQEAVELADRSGDPTLRGDCHNERANQLSELGDREAARLDYDLALDLRRRSGDRRSVARVLSNIACDEIVLGDLDDARRHLEEAKDIAQDLHDEGTLTMLWINLGFIHLQLHSHAQAEPFFGDATTLSVRSGDKHSTAYALLGLALSASLRTDREHAARLHGAVDTYLKNIGETLETLEAQLRSDDHDALRAAMGPSNFADRYEEGMALTERAAVSLAIDHIGHRDAAQAGAPHGTPS